MELEFPVYYNYFFKKKKTTIICKERMIEKIKAIFQETLNGPADLSTFKNDFVPDYKGIPDIVKELEYFSHDA